MFSVSFQFVLVSVITWYTCSLIEWGLHKLSHFNYLHAIHHIHMNHHMIYPPGQLLQKLPYLSGDGNAFLPLIIGIVLICCSTLSHFGISKYGVVLFVIECSIYLYVSDYMHQNFHIEGCWLEKYEWFIERRNFHFYHHYHWDMNMSLGAMDRTIDYVMNTYKKAGSNWK